MQFWVVQAVSVFCVANFSVTGSAAMAELEKPIRAAKAREARARGFRNIPFSL
jgi:hypothetical protein